MKSKNQKYQPFLEGNGSTSFSQTAFGTYNPYKIPPNFKIAETHHLATRIAAPPKDEDAVIDPISGLPVNNKQLSLCCSEEDMNFLSPGYPMYFQFIKFCLLILLTIILGSGMHNAYSFYGGKYCTDTDEEFANIDASSGVKKCNYNWINFFTLPNKQDDLVAVEKADIYNFFTIIILFLLMQFIRKIQKQTALECDERQITASDFTAKVTNIPRNFEDSHDIDEEIKNFFENEALPGIRLHVANVSVCYDCNEKEYVKQLIKEKTVLKDTMVQRFRRNELISSDEIVSVEKDIDSLQKQFDDINYKLADGKEVAKLFLGGAYVTFETQQELQKVLKFWRMSTFQHIRESLKPFSAFRWRGKVLKVKQAPEPSDINWANISVPRSKRIQLKIITTTITLIFLGLAFAAIYKTNSTKMSLLNDLQLKKKSGAGAQESTFELTLQIQVVSISASLLVTLVNQLLNFIIRFLVRNEKRATQTDFQASLSQKLTIAQVFNTAVVTFMVYLLFGNVAGPGGLTYTIFFVFITNGLVQWALAIFSPDYIIYELQKFYYSRKKDPLITQEQLNAAYKYPAFNFAEKYANYAKTTLVASFFAPLIPIVVPIAFIIVVGEYWIDKYMMLRKRSRGPAIGPELPVQFVNFLEYSMIFFSIGNFLFNFYIVHFGLEHQVLIVVGLVIGILHALLPTHMINEKLLPSKEEALTEDRYSLDKFKFYEDYDRSNPATNEVAHQSFIRQRTIDFEV